MEDPANDQTPPPPSNGNGEEKPAEPKAIRQIILTIWEDGQFSYQGNLGNDFAGDYGLILQTVKWLEHKLDLNFVEEKMAASSQAMGRLKAQAEANAPRVAPVRGGFPGPPQALRRM